MCEFNLDQIRAQNRLYRFTLNDCIFIRLQLGQLLWRESFVGSFILTDDGQSCGTVLTLELLS